jgi:Na+-translocating ferredoxin:NAD+ oxidoreductase RNF subunit RnfB
MNVIILSLIVLAGLAAIAAITVYVVAKKFHVDEDPRIDAINEYLPGVNCGGCGFPGCHAFAQAIVKQGSLDGLNCPAGGSECMQSIAPILGVEAVIEDPKIAVVRCSGTFLNSPKTVDFEGFQNCRFSNNLYTGDAGCPNGCLGLGDCVRSCQFDAMYMDEEVGLPVIFEDKCVACNACVMACPRTIIQLRLKGKKSRRIFVSCINKEKGAIAKKHCSVACIGCAKCQKACEFGAVTIQHNLAYIDFEKCKLCRKCAPECPTNAILEINFPPTKNS